MTFCNLKCSEAAETPGVNQESAIKHHHKVKSTQNLVCALADLLLMIYFYTFLCAIFLQKNIFRF